MWRSFARFPARPKFGHWLLLAAVLLCPSCSGGLHKVRGKVLYKGQPIKGAVVAFHPKGDAGESPLNPTGLTDEEGVFTLSTQKDAGAPAGEYVVTVLWLDVAASTNKPGQMPEGMPRSVDKLGRRYADPAKSGLTAVIKPGKNELEPFDLK